MKKKYLKKYILIGASLAAYFLLSGFSKSVTLDIRNDPVYRFYPVAEMVKDMSGNYDVIDRKYDQKSVYTAGFISDISENGKTFTVTADGNGNEKIKAYSFNDAVIEKMSAFKEGDHVKIYGKSVTNPFISEKVKIQICDIYGIKADNGGSYAGSYSFPGGKTFAKEAVTEKSIAGGKVTFSVPSKWVEAENKINTEYIEGLQYSLNEIRGEFSTSPEKLFIFYFAYEKNLRNISDRDNVKGVERAVIENILRGEDTGSFPRAAIKAESGIKYTYYDSDYVDTDRKYHNVEFVFTPVENDGVVCLLYVFNTSAHSEDIKYLMNTLSVK